MENKMINVEINISDGIGPLFIDLLDHLRHNQNLYQDGMGQLAVGYVKLTQQGKEITPKFKSLLLSFMEHDCKGITKKMALYRQIYAALGDVKEK